LGDQVYRCDDESSHDDEGIEADHHARLRIQKRALDSFARGAKWTRAQPR
jgi:hypothetical protein